MNEITPVAEQAMTEYIHGRLEGTWSDIEENWNNVNNEWDQGSNNIMTEYIFGTHNII